jgi:hypothetical protein
MSEFLAGHSYKELERMAAAAGYDARESSLKSWLQSFVGAIRPLYERLPRSSRGGVILLDDFGPPCQIFVFWVHKPERQFLLVTKEDSMPDVTVEVHGPLEVGQALDEVGRALQEPWLQKVVQTEQGETTYHDVLEHELIGLIRMLQFEIFNPKIGERGVVIKRGPDHCRWFTWHVVGNLMTADPKELALSTSQGWWELSERAKPAPEASIVNVKPEEPAPTLKGYCTYFLPPVWLGTRPQLDYMQKLYGVPVHSVLRLQGLTSYRGRLAGFGTTGLMVIAEPHKATCARYLNEIMCVALLTGLPMQAVSEADIGEIEVTDRGEIRSLAYPVSPARQRLAGIELGGTDEATLNSFRELAPESLAKVLKVAEGAINTEAKSDCAILLVQAGTLAGAAQYTQSYIFSWLALETHYRETFRVKVLGNRGSGTRVKKKVGVILEILHTKSIMNDNEFERIDKMRQKRNGISHQNGSASRAEALECYRECVRVVRSDLGLTEA